jgi:hypothetical protein
MVDAVISEIIAAAANDLTASRPTERPSYVFQNTFHGPITSVAQGGASVGNVSQILKAATPQELADAVALIIKALPVGQPDVEKAAADLSAAEAVEQIRWLCNLLGLS